MHACDVCQYLANRPKRFCTISPPFTLDNVLSYAVSLSNAITFTPRRFLRNVIFFF